MTPAFAHGRARRLSVHATLVVVVCLVMAGCGFTLRTPVAQGPTAQSIPTAPPDPYVKPRPRVVTPPVSTQPLALDPGQTVVSLTFDDGRDSQAIAARIMASHGLRGTFYVNSGIIGMPGHLSLTDLDSLAVSGQEIGGHTMTHPHLEDLTRDEVVRQICDDRDTLLDWGFQVRSFAFPFGAASDDDVNAARLCGYNSARGLGGSLRSVSNKDCQDCALTEQVPPADPMLTRAPAQVVSSWRATDLENMVLDATTAGGWLQLTFHDICSTECSDMAIPEAEFENFVTWLADKQAAGTVLVSTVGDVIGGPVQPAIVAPAPAPAPPGVNEVVNPGLEEQADGVPTCWTQGGFGNNTREFSLVPSAHSGTAASRLVMRNYVDGDAKLVQTPDLGTCAPPVSPGSRYTIEAWYTSTVPTSFSVQYRLDRGVWAYALSSPQFPATTEFSRARWTLPPIPQGVTAISFGLGLTQNGELVTDDYSLIADGGSPP